MERLLPLGTCARPLEQTVPIAAQTCRGLVGRSRASTAQAEGVRDWPSLGWHKDIRVNVADHAASMTCLLRAALPRMADAHARAAPQSL